MSHQEQALSEEDAALLARSAAGDRGAFERFVARHQASVGRFLAALGAGSDGEDLLQETFLAAWRGAASFRGDGSARSWLFTSARRRLWKLRARPEAKDEVTSLEELAEQAGWGTGVLVELAPRLTDRLALEQALSRLAPTDRSVLLLVDVESLSLAEAAEVADIGLPALKSRLHRARLRLAAQLGAGRTS